MSNRRITDQEPSERAGADETTEGQQVGGKRAVDVSVTQVAGSALAAVIAALIAGQLGVYGTIIGAGVISVVATTGGPVFQHLLRRTSEEVKGQVKQQGKATSGATPAARHTRRTRHADRADRTVAMPTAAQNDLQRTQPLLLDQPGPDGTRPLATVSEPEPDASYGAARTHGTRWRGWRRTLVPAVLVFVVAMGGITLYETLSGNNVSGGDGGTSIGQVFGRDSGKPATSPDDQAPDSPTDSEEDGGGHNPEDGTPENGGDQNGEAPREEPANPDNDADRPGQEEGTSGSDGQHGGTTPTPVPTPAPEEGAEEDATSQGGQDGGDDGGEQPRGTDRQPPGTDHAPGAE